MVINNKNRFSPRTQAFLAMAKGQGGFTLVELLVVISIIGVLSGFLFVNFASLRERARDAQRKRDLTEIKTALRLYYNDYQHYPANDLQGHIMGCGATGDAVCQWGSKLGSDATTYMMLPTDPLNSGAYGYSYTKDATVNSDKFTLQTVMENKGDPQLLESQRMCGVAAQNLLDNVFMVCNL
jgi:prepilin-type N-terminal cleavage/methylation domain-containing protein